jgi:hypothetical protein
MIDLRARVDELERAVAELRARVGQLERGAAPDEIAPQVAPPPVEEAVPRAGPSLALVGRTLIVLGGGYLLRALTDAHFLSPLGGIALGLLYAAAPLWLADRGAERASASFHGLSSAMLAYPLLAEAATRLGALPPPAAASLSALFLWTALAVAHRRQLALVAWSFLLFSLGSSLYLFVATGRVLPFVGALYAAALACEALAFDARWRALRWPAALALDLALAQLLAFLVHGLPDTYAPVPLGAALAVEVALPIVYLGSIAARTLALDRVVTVFGIVQCALALAIGLGGTASVLAAHGGSLAWVGVPALALAAGSYAVAHLHARARGRARNYHFYVTLGGLCATAGALALLRGPPLALALAAFAAIAGAVGARHHGSPLRWHAVGYLTAALASGWWPGVAVAAAGVWAIGAGLRARDVRPLPDAFAAALACGLAVLLLLDGAKEIVHSPAFLSTVRTALLAAAAAAAAFAARRFALTELGWLVHPLLAAGALKLLVEDFRAGSPASLFPSLAAYGAALILAPRLLRRSPPTLH